MFKSILLFIKAHAVATVITTIVVVGTAVIAPITINNYILDKNIRENLNMLVSSNFQSDVNNQTVEDNHVPNETQTVVNTDEPLTFRIEKVVIKQEGGGIVKDMQGNDAIEMSSDGIEYKIVPSYDKDYSKWTKADKEAYQKAYEDVAKMVEEEYKKNMANEENAMLDAIMVIQQINDSYSKDYSFNFNSGNGTINFESWSYNSYTKLYSCGTATQIYGEKIEKAVKVPGVQSDMIGITKEDFRNIVYPALKQKIESKVKQALQQQIKDNPAIAEVPNALNEFKGVLEKEKKEALSNLEELYHLSD